MELEMKYLKFFLNKIKKCIKGITYMNLQLFNKEKQMTNSFLIFFIITIKPKNLFFPSYISNFLWRRFPQFPS